MVEAQIIGLHGGSHGRLWIRFTHGTGLSSHHHEDDFTISRKDQETMLRLVTRMERYAGRCSKARSLRNKTQLRKINAKANALLQTGGKRIFKILRNGVTTVDVKSLDDLFEGNAPLTLIVDEKTRTFPWELAYDGNKFLFEYMIGRKIQDPPNASFDAGLEPQRLGNFGVSRQTLLDSKEQQAPHDRRANQTC